MEMFVSIEIKHRENYSLFEYFDPVQSENTKSNLCFYSKLTRVILVIDLIVERAN
jgi:hypothetical protein